MGFPDLSGDGADPGFVCGALPHAFIRLVEERVEALQIRRVFLCANCLLEFIPQFRRHAGPVYLRDNLVFTQAAFVRFGLDAGELPAHKPAGTADGEVQIQQRLSPRRQFAVEVLRDE